MDIHRYAQPSSSGVVGGEEYKQHDGEIEIHEWQEEGRREEKDYDGVNDNDHNGNGDLSYFMIDGVLSRRGQRS